MFSVPKKLLSNRSRFRCRSRLDQCGNLFAQPGSDSIDSTGAISSPEKDVFLGWMGCGLSGYMNLGQFVDIGTPEDFTAVENFFAGMKQHRYVVLDRDGAIIEELECLFTPRSSCVDSGCRSRAARPQTNGIRFSGDHQSIRYSLWFFDRSQLERIHRRFEELLECEGVQLDGLYPWPVMPRPGGRGVLLLSACS